MEEKQTGSLRRTVVDRGPGSIRTAFPRLVTGLAACLVLLGACAATPVPRQKLKLHRPPPSPPPAVQHLPPATLSRFGDEPELKVSAVDNLPWEQLASGLLLRDPMAPGGDSSAIGVLLVPGVHLIHGKYVRNIEGGVTFVQGSLRLTAQPGHTYMMRPTAGSERGKVSFSMVDYGVAFPTVCLPGAINNALQPGQKPQQRARFTHDQITRCAQLHRAR